MNEVFPFFSQVPMYREGALVPLTQPRWFVQVISALARSFCAATNIDDEDRRLDGALLC